MDMAEILFIYLLHIFVHYNYRCVCIFLCIRYVYTNHWWLFVEVSLWWQHYVGCSCHCGLRITKCVVLICWLEHWTYDQQVVALTSGISTSLIDFGQVVHRHITPVIKQFNLVLAKVSPRSDTAQVIEKSQNKGYYGVQGHSRSSRSVPIESPYATSY